MIAQVTCGRKPGPRTCRYVCTRRQVAVVRIWSHEAAAAAAAVDAPTAISHFPKVSVFTVDLLFKRARSVYSGGLSDLGASQYFSGPPPHAHELWCAVFISA